MSRTRHSGVTRTVCPLHYITSQCERVSNKHPWCSGSYRARYPGDPGTTPAGSRESSPCVWLFLAINTLIIYLGTYFLISKKILSFVLDLDSGTRFEELARFPPRLNLGEITSHTALFLMKERFFLSVLLASLGSLSVAEKEMLLLIV